MEPPSEQMIFVHSDEPEPAVDAGAMSKFREILGPANIVVNFSWVCPHTLEDNWPVDGGDLFAHTHCDCPKVVYWHISRRIQY